MFQKGSRYWEIPERTRMSSDGREVRFKALRIVPLTRGSTTHTVSGEERLDLVADAVYRDARRYWRICDGNRCLHPSELEGPVGRRLVVPPSEE